MKLSSTYINLNQSTAENVAIPNVVTVKLGDQVTAKKDVFKGIPISCSKCDAIFNWVIETPENSPKCLFCKEKIEGVRAHPLPPSLNETTYLLKETEASHFAHSDSKYLVFCMDLSGSMNQTVEIEPNIELVTDQKREEKKRLELENLKAAIRAIGDFNENDFKEENYKPSGKKLVSQLEVIQTALYRNIQELEEKNPDKRVGLVTFSNKVCVIGDGNMPVTTIEGEELNDKEALENRAQNIPQFEHVGLKKGVMLKQVVDLEADGETALGPALLLSVLIAGRKMGSRVILCTDGKANRGLGSVEVVNERSIKFYEDIAVLAREKGVLVSILTIAGKESSLGVIGSVATANAGQIIQLDPTNPLIVEENVTISVRQGPIATNLKTRFYVHPEFYIKDYTKLNERSNKFLMDVGNVRRGAEIFFEFAVKERSNLRKIPVQLQLEYVAADGRRLLDVKTVYWDATSDEALVETNVDRKVLAMHVIRLHTQVMGNSPAYNELTRLADKIDKISAANDYFYVEEFQKIIRELREMKKGHDDQMSKYLTSAMAGKTGSAPPLMAFANDVTVSQYNKYSNLTSEHLHSRRKK